MSLLLEMFAALSSGAALPGGTVTLSGEAIADQAGGDRLYRAALVIRTDGTLDKIENTTTTQIDSGTDWIDPNGDASADFEFKYELDSGDALDVSSSVAASTWLAVSSDIFLEQRWAAGAGIGSKASTITVSVRFDGGSVIDTGVFTLTAERLV